MAALTRQVRYTLEQWRDREALRAVVAGAFVGPFLGIWLSLYCRAKCAPGHRRDIDGPAADPADSH